MADLFWLSDEQWAVIEPFLPRNQPGPERKDDRRIISGRDCQEFRVRAAIVDPMEVLDGTTQSTPYP